MRLTLVVTLILTSIAFLCSCATSPKVAYGDAQAVETTTADFGSTDLQGIAEKMVDSLLLAPFIGSDRPVFFVSRIKNKTSEHIDTEAITDTVRTKLLKSGKVRFTATTDIGDEILNQLEYQTGTGLVDPSTGINYGRQIGARYALYGAITSIVKTAKKTKDVYYKFTLNCADLETGIIEWAEEKEIRKTAKRGSAGW